MDIKNQIKSKASSTGSSIVGAGKNFANQGWSAIPMPVKGVLFLLVGYGVYKLAKNAIGSSRLNEPVRDSKQEIDGWYASLQQDTQQQAPTMSTTQMKSVANKIHTCMDGYGTRDYDLIRAFKQIKNNADFSGVSAAYGVRTLQPGYGVGWMGNSFKGTMVQCIEDDASSSTMNTINAGLASRGIKYRI